jgi:glycosyltransferase involved in cell wall biosynthesis
MHWMAWVLQRLLGVQATNFIGYSPLVHPDRHSDFRLSLAKANIRLFHAGLVLCRSPAVKSFVDSTTASETRILHGIVDSELLREVASNSKAEIRTSLSVPDDERVIAFVGRLVPIKRPLTAVEVVAGLDDVHLLIVGKGPLENDIRDVVRERGLQDRVTLTGEVPPATALEYIACVDGLLITSEAESYCSVALEALALDRPVFATPVGIMTNLSEDALYLGTVEELKTLLAKASTAPEIQLNEEILTAYSMHRFTTDFLAELEASA